MGVSLRYLAGEDFTSWRGKAALREWPRHFCTDRTPFANLGSAARQKRLSAGLAAHKMPSE